MEQAPSEKIYHHREPGNSPFFKVVTHYFPEFERSYIQKFEEKYGFWRPVIHTSLEKFLKCGDLREGFAGIKCNDCGHGMFVPFSCHQRCSCRSCHQKRSLIKLIHKTEDVIEPVSSA